MPALKPEEIARRVAIIRAALERNPKLTKSHFHKTHGYDSKHLAKWETEYNLPFHNGAGYTWGRCKS